MIGQWTTNQRLAASRATPYLSLSDFDVGKTYYTTCPLPAFCRGVGLDLGIVLIEKGKDHIEVELTETTGDVLLEPLKERLLADKTVELATHDSDHPMYGKRRLFVRVKSGKPQNAVKRALKEISTDLNNAKKAVDKAKPTKK